MPDQRDFQLGVATGTNLLKRLFAAHATRRPRHMLKEAAVPTAHLLIDPHRKGDLWDAWPVEDQGQLHSCTAHAVLGIVEYLLRRQCCRPLDLSRLFLYNATRRLLGWTGDSGATLRSTIKALGYFGAPPEELWPYDPAYFESDPSAFLFAYAANLKPFFYMRLDGTANPDPPHHHATQGKTTLGNLKAALADGYPVAFGFPLFSCIRDGRRRIPFPTTFDNLIAGHAALAVGYDDHFDNRAGAKGAVMFRNSWGKSWGWKGYGFLPYEYFTEGLAVDLWTLFNPDWIEQSTDPPPPPPETTKVKGR
jgi:C1A family cysteine protease